MKSSTTFNPLTGMGIDSFLIRFRSKRQQATSIVLEYFIGLTGFYGTSTIVGYLMPNPFYTYILNNNDLV